MARYRVPMDEQISVWRRWYYYVEANSKEEAIEKVFDGEATDYELQETFHETEEELSMQLADDEDVEKIED